MTSGPPLLARIPLRRRQINSQSPARRRNEPIQGRFRRQ